jgi:hypothetical protein
MVLVTNFLRDIDSQFCQWYSKAYTQYMRFSLPFNLKFSGMLHPFAGNFE